MPDAHNIQRTFRQPIYKDLSVTALLKKISPFKNKEATLFDIRLTVKQILKLKLAIFPKKHKTGSRGKTSWNSIECAVCSQNNNANTESTSEFNERVTWKTRDRAISRHSFPRRFTGIAFIHRGKVAVTRYRHLKHWLKRTLSSTDGSRLPLAA